MKFEVGMRVKCIQPISSARREYNLCPHTIYVVTQVSTDVLSLEGTKKQGYMKERFIAAGCPPTEEDYNDAI